MGHTYETDEPPGGCMPHPNRLDVIGANGRGLIARRSRRS